LGESSQQIITELLEANQGPYSGWKLYNKQESKFCHKQRSYKNYDLAFSASFEFIYLQICVLFYFLLHGVWSYTSKRALLDGA